MAREKTESSLINNLICEIPFFSVISLTAEGTQAGVPILLPVQPILWLAALIIGSLAHFFIHTFTATSSSLMAQCSALVDEAQEAGYKSVNFPGARLSSGVYFYRLNAGRFTHVRKMAIIK